jgi:hypothetical protein
MQKMLYLRFVVMAVLLIVSFHRGNIFGENGILHLYSGT